MKRTPEQGALMHQLLRELPLLENLAMRAGLPITCRAIQNAVRASGWEAAGDTERANYYAPNTEGFAAGVKEALAPLSREVRDLMLLAATDLAGWAKKYDDAASADTAKRLREAALGVAIPDGGQKK